MGLTRRDGELGDDNFSADVPARSDGHERSG